MATFVRTQEIDHEIGPSGSFSLRVTHGEVHLRGVDGPVARVRATYELRASSDADADELLEQVQLRADRAPGALQVTEPKAPTVGGLARLFGFGAGAELRLEAEVPRQADLGINVVNAEVTGGGFRGAQHYRTVSGDIVLNDVGGALRLQAVSGDVSIRGDGELGLEASSVSGDLSAVTSRFVELRASTVSGDLDLEGELAAGSGHRVETVSGDLSLGVIGGLTLQVRGLSTDVDATIPHRSEGSRDRRRYVVAGGEATLDFSSMSGDVSLHPARRAAVRAAPVAAAPSPPRRPADESQLETLRALERGEIDVDEAARRLGAG